MDGEKREREREKNRIPVEISRVRYFALINNLMQMSTSAVPGDLHYMIIYTCLRAPAFSFFYCVMLSKMERF